MRPFRPAARRTCSATCRTWALENSARYQSANPKSETGERARDLGAQRRVHHVQVVGQHHVGAGPLEQGVRLHQHLHEQLRARVLLARRRHLARRQRHPAVDACVTGDAQVVRSLDVSSTQLCAGCSLLAAATSPANSVIALSMPAPPPPHNCQLMNMCGLHSTGVLYKLGCSKCAKQRFWW